MTTATSSSRTSDNLAAARARALRIVPAAVAACALVLLLSPAPGVAAERFTVSCVHGGDQFGYAIATNGDLNGDGVPDLAVGSPCAHVRNSPRAGRVNVFSGVNGRRLFSRKGGQTGQWLGASVSFIPDINGDGRDELAIGSPGYDVTQLDDPTLPAWGLSGGGKVEVFQRDKRFTKGYHGKRRLLLFGTASESVFGEKIAPLNDVNDDGKPDFAVSASRDKREPGDGRGRSGRVYIFSGKDGEMLGYRVGSKKGERYGRSLATAGDVDGDGKWDLLVASHTGNIFGSRKQGVVDTVSPVELDEELSQVVGAKKDGMGKAIAAVGDIDDDEVPDFVAGSIKSDDTEGVIDPGLVTLFSGDGEPRWVVADTRIQEKAQFGAAVASFDDVDGDGIVDIAATALAYDNIARGRLAVDAGRVVALSGADGSQIWETNGTLPLQTLGFSLSGWLDWDEDDLGDLVVGSIGDAPHGRRGAGSVHVVSGEDGVILKTFAGRRGLETRIVVAAPITDTINKLGSFKADGRKGELRSDDLFEETAVGEFSVAILDDYGRPHPNEVTVAVGTGANSRDSSVEVFSLGNRDRKTTTFDPFPDIANTGVNVGAGFLDATGGEDLACVQADSDNGDVLLRAFRRFEDSPDFHLINEFPAFTAGELHMEFNVAIPINAGGATVAVGDIDRSGLTEEKIILGTTSGLPVVKIVTVEGEFVRSFLAYDPVGFDGVDVALGDINGDGTAEIITAPRSGQALIKAFHADGTLVRFGLHNTPVSFLAMDESYIGGARVAAADVDYDDVQEILVLIPGPTSWRFVKAFEMTTEEVNGFEMFAPFNKKTSLPGGAIAGTDLFVRD